MFVHFKWLNCMVYELQLNKALPKNKKTKKVPQKYILVTHIKQGLGEPA